jgi:hypothetical protein
MDLQSYKVGDKVIYTDRGEKLNAIVLSTETKTLRGMMKELRIQFLTPEGDPAVSGPQGMPTMIINDPTTLEKASGGRRRRKTRKPRRKIRNTRRYRK